jgi:hypothetical protein
VKRREKEREGENWSAGWIINGNSERANKNSTATVVGNY